MKIVPLSHRMVCEETKDQGGQTDSGIVIAAVNDENRQKIVRAKVISIGPKVKEVNEGDIVLLGEYQYIEVESGAKKLILADDRDVDAKIVDVEAS